MKKYIQILGVVVLFAAFNSFTVQAQVVEDSVTMGEQYANDIFYSFANGEVASANRTDWDIAFYTAVWSAGIITNDGNGVELYVYPNGDTSAWQTVDTTGLSTWTAYYNSTDDWEEGAFNRTASGHPDYGWGTYNTITHNVTGDSICLLKFADGSFKKILIQEKLSTLNTYLFKYANLDGSEEVSESVDVSPYASKNFVYYSLHDQQLVDREPASDSWDIVFTKYVTMLEGGVPYPVTGVLNNLDVPANRFDMVAPDFDDWSATPMDSTRAPIGYDWKNFDMTTFEYVVQDSLSFFVQNRDQDVYKLVFEVFDYTIGHVVFNTSMVSASSIFENRIPASFVLAPNPASQSVSIVTQSSSQPDEIILSNLQGRVILQQNFEGSGQSINLDQLTPGLYLVELRSGSAFEVRKLLVR